MVSQAVNDAVTKLQDTASNSVAELRPHARDAVDQLSSHKERVGESARHAVQAGKKWMRSTAGDVSHWCDEACDYVSDHAQSAVRSARSHPLATVAIAAGIGLLIGSFLMFSRRR